MKRLLALGTAFATLGAAGVLGLGTAAADDTPVPPPPPVPGAGPQGPPPIGTPGRAYALGGAHVLGIPYDEYIMRTGAEWFPGLDRQIVDYPAGQVQGHTLERLFPGIGRLGGGDLDADAAGGERVAVDAQRREFIGDEGVESGGLELGPDQLRLGRIEGSINGGGAHEERFFGAAGALRNSAKTMTPAPVWRRL